MINPSGFRTTLFPLLLASLTLAVALPAVAEDTAPAAPATQTAPTDSKPEEKGTLLHPKVEKPIPDTYKSLNGTRFEDRDEGTGQVRESWELKKEKKDQDRDKKTKAVADKKAAPALNQNDIKIQDGVPIAPAPAGPPPKIEDNKDSISIHDQ